MTTQLAAYTERGNWSHLTVDSITTLCGQTVSTTGPLLPGSWCRHCEKKMTFTTRETIKAARTA